ncbi:MAG: urea carboxylase [Granulosicoccus sp.]|nr:urea carboxylase [Granulosicoccus sp.]
MTRLNRVLIANRGAIATRIIRTLHKLRIESLAVYAESDRDSLHVQHAGRAISLGHGPAADTYLNIDRLIKIAKDNACDAIHPGYGFLSENAHFVERCEAASLIFIGPTAEQIRLFGQKHQARELAEKAGVPLLPGTGLLAGEEDAIKAAERIGFPIMLKSTAGGGGIGMQLCSDEEQLRDAFTSVKRLGQSNFANDGVFVEKAIVSARHIEVQTFGDGHGQVVSLGERDCSAQRRNQKVLEECPAPNLTEELRSKLCETAETLLQSVDYRNAGTVEFIVDATSQEFYFLEVNTRLQVEHGVTELVYGVDLVEWMVQHASDTTDDLADARSRLKPQGHAIQVRLYAEDPYREFQPCAGPLTEVHFPKTDGVRIDRWIESGMHIPATFDPMLAKVIAHADTRAAALAKLQQALDATRLYGSETNLAYLQALSRDPKVKNGSLSTRYLETFKFHPHRIDILRPGTLTTIQDHPGRTGYWSVGIPPSGPFDGLSFQLANRLLGNEPEAAGIEITVQGPILRFSRQTEVVVTGGEVPVSLDGQSVPMWTVLTVGPNQTLEIGSLKGLGARAYLCVRYGIQCPDYLGSRSTFTLGQFGGHNGAAVKTGDVLHLLNPQSLSASTTAIDELPGRQLPNTCRPAMAHDWVIRTVYGPHGAPEFFTEDDIQMLFNTEWEVHYNSSRTGIRLIGPTPQWARSDGGEAGLHPSNIHDNAYAFGSIDFTGDMPVILGPDGPSLGGFVCPATVITADLWKIGQLRAGDKVRFFPVGIEQAVEIHQQQQLAIAQPFDSTNNQLPVPELSEIPAKAKIVTYPSSPIVATRNSGQIKATYRAAGDRFLLIEYGEAVLELASRFRVHALMQWLDANPLEGVIETTPGIRSLQIHYDCHALTLSALLEYLMVAENALDNENNSATVSSRIVHLPLSWDDEACRQAIEKYHQSVRENAPWYPSNLEFIRRINGLDSIDEVKQIVFDAAYLVMGLGDVYLGAPVATPINPAHRLVTTKYNPARTWTAENSVGIGGSYLCIYGMEGPGGYQFVGRTLQMWNRYKVTQEFSKPWLLRFFDQIKFFEVSHEELMRIRADFPHGRYELSIEETEFSLTEFQQLIHQNKDSIEAFKKTRHAAFEQELDQWRATGQFNIANQEPDVADVQTDWPDHCTVIESPVSGSLWQCCVEPGDKVDEDQLLLILESMKMEINVASPAKLRVRKVLFESGQQIIAGQPLIVLDAL